LGGGGGGGGGSWGWRDLWGAAGGGKRGGGGGGGGGGEGGGERGEGGRVGNDRGEVGRGGGENDVSCEEGQALRDASEESDEVGVGHLEGRGLELAGDGAEVLEDGEGLAQLLHELTQMRLAVEMRGGGQEARLALEDGPLRTPRGRKP